MMIDEAFVANYGGNLMVARSQAMALFDEAKAGLTTMISGTGHILNMQLVNFTVDLAPDTWYNATDRAAWVQNVSNYWHTSDKRCIKKDIMIFLTGHAFGADGQAFGPGVVCDPGYDFPSQYGKNLLLIGKNGGATTLAHETLHAFGLDHLTSTVCNPLCSSNDAPLMCDGGSDKFLFSTCDLVCVQKFFDQLKCPCLQVVYPAFPSDYTCPEVVRIGYSAMSDNEHPNIGCRANGDLMTITATLINDNSITARNIRAFIPASAANLVEFVADPTLDFNCLQNIPGSRTEFLITDAPSSTCNNETYFSLDSVETKTVRLKVRYKGGIETSGVSSFSVFFYTGNNFNLNQYNFKIYPFFEKTNAQQTSGWSPTNPLLVSGTYLMDNTTPITFGNGPSLTTGAPLTLFKPGASLVIGSGSVVKMEHASFEGCEQMWQGVTVREGALLEMHSMSSIKDAQTAVAVQNGGVLKASDCLFLDNNFGIRPVSDGHGNHEITVLGAQFGTTSAGLKPTYPGQSPAPYANRGFVGIDLVRDNTAPMAFVLQKSAAGLDNKFFNLHNGILARNTDLAVKNSFFENIINIPGAPPLFSGTPSGRAIFVSGGSLAATGPGSATADPANFNNCHTGIQSMNATLNVTHNKMTGMQYGILSGVTSNKTVEISQNDVQASDKGIGVYHLATLPNGCNVIWNEVTMAGNASGIGIHSGLFGSTFQDGGNISNNDVTVTDGDAGISIGVSRNLKVYQNDVTLSNAATRQGIGIAGGDRNSVNCNHISGAGENGIYSLMTGRSSFACNSTLNTGYGLNFEGVAEGKAPNFVAGNTMADNTSAGLLLGADALIGPQEHRGNVWTNAGGVTMAQHLNPLLAFESRFIVDPAENPAYMPAIVSPFAWFIPQVISPLSYQCLPNNTCPFPVSPSDPVRDLQIAGGVITGLAHQEPQLWITKRRLYERLTEEGNPYPGNATINTFLTQAQSNGIKAFGDLQIGFRQLYNLSIADLTELNYYETQIALNLDLLAQKEALLNAFGISLLDSISLSNERNTILQNLSNLTTSQQTKLNSIASFRALSAATLTAQNNALTGTADHLVNEKAINNIMLQMASSGNTTLSVAQLLTLQSIASQCALSGGEAVLVARTILALIQESPVSYNEELLCSTLPRPSSGANVVNAGTGNMISVFPNPAKEQITVKYDFHSLENARLQLLDVYGRIVSEYLLPGSNGEQVVTVIGLNSGIYIIALDGIASGRIIIKH